MTLDLKALNRLLDELGPTVAQANDASPTPDPMTTKSVGDGLAAKNPYGSSYDFLSDDDSYMLQKRMNPLSLEEKGYLLKEQLKKGSGRGVQDHNLALYQLSYDRHQGSVSYAERAACVNDVGSTAALKCASSRATASSSTANVLQNANLA